MGAPSASYVGSALTRLTSLYPPLCLRGAVGGNTEVMSSTQAPNQVTDVVPGA